MTRSRNQNRRVVISDSESDLDDDPKNSIDNAKVTRRSSSHLDSNTKPSIGAASEDSSGSDLDDASSKSYYHTPLRSNNDTTCSIGGSKTVKRKADTWDDIDPDNIISPSPRVSNQANTSQNNGEHPGQEQRLTRGHGGKTVSYDMKHHPMDVFLRPKYSAKRRANGIQVPRDSSDGDEEVDEAVTNNSLGGKEVSSNPHRRRSSRNILQTESPKYSAKWHPFDQMLRDNDSSPKKHSKKSHKRFNDSVSTLKDDEDSKTVSSDLAPNQDIARVSDLGDESAPISPDLRRSARVSSSRDTPPNYDMKYHVMDSTLRPKAAAKRMKSKLHSAISNKTLSKSASSVKTHTKQLTTILPKSSTERSGYLETELELRESDVPVTPAWSQLQNPYLNRYSLSWDELQDLDRYVYLLQKGAPLHGNTIPRDWDHVGDVLFDEGLVTLDEVSSWEGFERLKTRYESVRLGLQNFFNSRPEPIDKKDWTLLRTERFDAYDMKRGRKYWRHQRDSVYGLRFAAESADHVTGGIDEGQMHRIWEEQDTNEEKTWTSIQDIDNHGTTPNNPSSKRPSPSKVDVERTTSVDHEDDAELGLIIENEDSLVESMRGEHPLRDAVLEELLFPDEQYSMEESNRAFEFSGLVLIHRDKALDEVNSVASEAKATDLDTSSRELAESIPHDKEKSTLGAEVDPRNEFGMLQTPRVQIKARKRKPRADVPISVHEDLPNSTPEVKKIMSMNPASPGTDIPKENLDDEERVERSSQVEMGNHQTRRRYEAIETPNTRRFGRLESATSVTPPYSSLFGGPLGSLSPGSSPTTR